MGTVKRAPASPPTIHQLKVTLKGIRPPIWRRIQVRSTITLAELHDVIQATMGWDDSHLHEFRAGGTAYGDPDMLEDDLFGDMGTRSERGARLKAVAPAKGNKLHYLYDFGDSWDHELLVEDVLPPARGTRYPYCLTGRRAGPPEDCGGVWGYANLIEIMGDPAHEEHAFMLEWLGRPLDPEAFAVEEINGRLAFFH